MSLLALLQTVPPTTLEFPSWLTPTLIIGALVWLIREQRQTRDDVRSIKQWVSGIDGTNGANSKINQLRADVDELQSLPISDLAQVLRYEGPEHREVDTRRAEDRIVMWLRGLVRRAHQEDTGGGK